MMAFCEHDRLTNACSDCLRAELERVTRERDEARAALSERMADGTRDWFDQIKTERTKREAAERALGEVSDRAADYEARPVDIDDDPESWRRLNALLGAIDEARAAAAKGDAPHEPHRLPIACPKHGLLLCVDCDQTQQALAAAAKGEGEDGDGED